MKCGCRYRPIAAHLDGTKSIPGPQVQASLLPNGGSMLAPMHAIGGGRLGSEQGVPRGYGALARRAEARRNPPFTDDERRVTSSANPPYKLRAAPIFAPMVSLPQITSRDLVLMACHYSRPCGSMQRH